MCGRFASTTSPSQLADYFSVDELAAEGVSENFNVAPTQEVMVVAEDAEHHRVLDAYRWGLVPSWAKDLAIGNKMINARAETVAEKPAYRRAFAKRRCIIPATGFFEWKKLPGQKAKQPYFIHPTGEPVFAFAGLWEFWKGDDDHPGLRSCAIITGEANATVAPIHDRMPVVLPREHWDEWLDPANDDVDALARLLVPMPASGVATYAVSTRVNSPRNNSAENLDRVADPDA
jgi:putative SOS response-associated peptidase YedK